MYDLSICLPAIRKENWTRLYESAITSVGKYSFELIFCGPHKELPEELQELENVKCLQDFGCPTRAHQIACIEATGEFLTWCGDDGWFEPNMLEKCIDLLKDCPEPIKAVVPAYVEIRDRSNEDGLGVYNCNYHEPIRSSFNPDHWLVFMSALVQTEQFKELGGFDCNLQVPGISIADFGIRYQRNGACVTQTTDVVFTCTHTPGRTGDHYAIHDAQTKDDQPLFKMIQSTSDVVDRIKLDINNWKNSPEVWTRRFGNL